MRPLSSGKLFVFEGPDGVGKSTILTRIQLELRDTAEVAVGAFPGSASGSLGRHVYALHHSPTEFGVDHLRPDSLQLMHVAAHLDAINGWIAAAIQSKKVILLDRFWWSTYVYGLVAGLPETTIDRIVGIELPFWRANPPDGVFLLSRPTLPPDNNHPLVSAYRSLANKERQFTSVHELVNDGSVEDAARRVMFAIHESDGK